MSNRCLVIVIVEDEHHEMLIRRYLRPYGTHSMRILRSPSGEGSAENWVRKIFAKEAHIYRNRHAQTKLIVMIDADRSTVQDRLKQLDQALEDSGEDAVNVKAEQIARLVPKRHIETWFLCLNGIEVDESTNAKEQRYDWKALIPSAANILLQWTQLKGELPEHCIDSLQHGIHELKHLKL